MAHYAFLDDNNFVVDIIVGIDETELIEGKDPETWYGELRNQKCVRYSYNGNIRKNAAGVGSYYDKDRDAFISPKPFDSWILDEDTCKWQAPTPLPENGEYYWDEETLDWVEIKP
jgi:hypothetical protein